MRLWCGMNIERLPGQIGMPIKREKARAREKKKEIDQSRVEERETNKDEFYGKPNKNVK